MADLTIDEGTYASSFDGKSIFYRSWIHARPSANVYIAHGMSEHSGRYADFAVFIANSLKVNVFANDHRGHGRTACPQESSSLCQLGKFSTVQDAPKLSCLEVAARDILDLIEKDEKNLPIVIFGHSMGSLIARWVLRVASDSVLDRVRGVILSGVPTVPPLHERGPLLLLLNAAIALGKGGDKLHHFVMGKFDDAVRRKEKNWKLPRNTFISSVAEEVVAFNADPLCGQTVDLNLWKSLRSTLIELMDARKFYASLKGRKLFFAYVSGREDPICDYGRTAQWESKALSKLGHSVTEIYLSGCRHEFLHEQDEVKLVGLDQVRAWMKSRL